MTRLRMAATLLGTMIALVAVRDADATMLLRRTPLATVTAEAGRIVHGTVTDVRSGRDERGIPATWVTLTVARMVKGAAVGRVVVKQFGAMEPLDDGTLGAVPGMPRYRAGEEVVLFLRPESAHGFTSPVRFADGVYRVAPGRRIRGAAAEPQEDVDAFLERVGALVGRR